MKTSSDTRTPATGETTKYAEYVIDLTKKPTTRNRPGMRTTVVANDMPPFELADALNRYFQIGCCAFTRHELLAYGGMNWSRVENCLREWESRGLLQVLKPLAGAQDGEIVVKLLHPIEEQRYLNRHMLATAAEKHL